MKYFLRPVFLSAILIVMLTKSQAQTTSVADRIKSERSQNAAIEKRIDDLIKQMTLEEKIGQMTQLNNSVIATNAQWGAGTDLRIEIKVDTAKLGRRSA